MTKKILILSVFVVASCGLAYELIAGALSSYLLGDSVLTPGDGMRGVRDVFSYQVQGQQQTFDQTVLANEDLTKVYLLLVRCSSACYSDRRDELQEIAQSFTVRG